MLICGVWYSVLLLLGGGCEASRLRVRGLRSTVGGGGVESRGNTGHKSSSDIATLHYAAVMEASKCVVATPPSPMALQGLH